jgi:hypothetical protein
MCHFHSPVQKCGQSPNDFSITRIPPKDRATAIPRAKQQGPGNSRSPLPNLAVNNASTNDLKNYLPFTAITSISTSAHGAANAATCMALLAGLFG